MQAIFEEIMAQNDTKSMKAIIPSSVVYIENHTWAHQNAAAENPRQRENLKSSHGIKGALPSNEEMKKIMTMHFRKGFEKYESTQNSVSAGENEGKIRTFRTNESGENLLSEDPQDENTKGSSLGQRKTNPRCQYGEAGGMKGIEGAAMQVNLKINIVK